jgi:hypothetical protein
MSDALVAFYHEEGRESANANPDLLWTAPGRWQPSPEMLARVRRVSAEVRHDCVLLGPPGSGQTSLIAALPRVSAISGLIGVIPLPSLAGLAGRAVAALRGGGPPLPSTESPATYGLQLRVLGGHGATGASHVEIDLRDWPGRWIFPAREAASEEHSARIERFVEEAREAACLVLCVPAQDPRQALGNGLLASLLSRLAVSTGSLVPRLASSNGRVGVPPVLTPRLVLPFERVLVLLTKVDLLCRELIESLSVGGRQPGNALWATVARLTRTARDAALSIDPLRFAEEGLDGLLTSLHSMLRPGATLAVGLTSSRGFASRDTDPGAAGLADGVDAPRDTSPLVFPPFGLLESLLFIATGRARPPIELVEETSPGRADDSFIELLP